MLGGGADRRLRVLRRLAGPLRGPTPLKLASPAPPSRPRSPSLVKRRRSCPATGTSATLGGGEIGGVGGAPTTSAASAVAGFLVGGFVIAWPPRPFLAGSLAHGRHGPPGSVSGSPSSGPARRSARSCCAARPPVAGPMRLSVGPSSRALPGWRVCADHRRPAATPRRARPLAAART
ncbi:hypothetical protein LV779_15675 [Streptomyces thinghirensis]|nr:hypothetical protein [Streptomyces thinghirensis]